jgi:hypothetical protein
MRQYSYSQKNFNSSFDVYRHCYNIQIKKKKLVLKAIAVGVLPSVLKGDIDSLYVRIDLAFPKCSSL